MAPPFIASPVLRLLRELALGRYVRKGRPPWSAGYATFKWRLIESLLSSEETLEAFRNRGTLPPGHGLRIDERCVEYPWVVAHLPRGPGRLLDAGSALNHAPILETPRVREKDLHVLTLEPEERAFWSRGVSYLYANLRDIPVRDSFYDTVVCLSTLEHVGFEPLDVLDRDSAGGGEREDRFLEAVDEMWRVLRRGGELLVTVPFGAPEHHGTFRQFDTGLVERTVGRVPHPIGAEVVHYRYLPGGWQVSTPDECAGAHYSEDAARMWAGGGERHSGVGSEGDGAAAARAVACIRLRKGS